MSTPASYDKKAMGGKDKIKTVQTKRVTGKMIMGQEMEASFTMDMARPNKVRGNRCRSRIKPESD